MIRVLTVFCVALFLVAGLAPCSTAEETQAEVAAENPDAIVRQAYDPHLGLQPFEARSVVRRLGLTGKTEIYYTGQSWPGDINRLVAGLDKIKATGYQPTVELPDGLRRFADWIDIM